VLLNTSIELIETEQFKRIPVLVNAIRGHSPLFYMEEVVGYILVVLLPLYSLFSEYIECES